jgi:hypothetical protein
MRNLLLAITLVSFGFSNAQKKEKETFELTPKIGYANF